jgi:hypothetical protein
MPGTVGCIFSAGHKMQPAAGSAGLTLRTTHRVVEEPYMNGNSALFLFLAVASVAFWSFVAVASWAEARRKERESFYRHELLRKIVDSPEAGASALAYLKETELAAAHRVREGVKIGGVIAVLVAVGLMVFLSRIVPNRPVYLVGLMPLLAGIGLLTYAFVLSKDR